ncbi:hypothetical protein HYY73_01990 [Candidatus Woesearchaeota archaeon]|nr:hypothetical protein [Candidatus Woesearchaeota archaeon]
MLIFLFVFAFTKTANAETLFNNSNTELSYSELDRFKCYSSFDADSYFIPDSFMLEQFYSNLSEFLNEQGKVGDHIYKDNNTYYGHPFARYYISNEEGKVFELDTDGIWWLLSYTEKNISLSNSEEYVKISGSIYQARGNFQRLRMLIGQAFRTYLQKDRKLNVDYCQMASDTTQWPVALKIVNLQLGDGYMNKTGCVFEQGLLKADCKNSKILGYIPTNGDFWRKKDYSSRIDYKAWNNFVFLDKSDLTYAERNYEFDTFGEVVVLSESQFVSGLSTGQIAFADHMEFLRHLVEIPINTKVLVAANNQIVNETDRLFLAVQNINRIVENTNISAKEKILKLNDLPGLNSVTIIQDGRKVLLSQQEQYIDEQSFISDRASTYFGDYYSELSRKYLANHAGALATLKDNLEYYDKLNQFLKTYKAQVQLTLVSEVSRQENQKESNRQVILAVLLTSLSTAFTALIFITENLVRRYGKDFHSLLLKRKYLFIFLVSAIILASISLKNSSFLLRLLLSLVYFLIFTITRGLILWLSPERKVNK